MFLKEILEVIGQVIEGFIDLIIALKPGVAAICAHPLVAGVAKVLGIVLGIPIAIISIASWIKHKISK